MINTLYASEIANEVRLLEEQPTMSKADIVTKLSELNSALVFQFLLEQTKKRNARIKQISIQIGAYSAMLYDAYYRTEKHNKTQIGL